MAVPALDDQRRRASERLQAAGLPASELLATPQIRARLVTDPVSCTYWLIPSARGNAHGPADVTRSSDG